MGNHRLSLLSTEDREHAMHEMHLSVHDDFCSDPLQQDDQKLDKRSGETLEMRSASTGSLPALGRKLSSGSLKAVKWIGKQFKSKKAGSSDSDDDELWGTSREAASGKDAKAAKEIEVPNSSGQTEALEKHKRDIYSFDWDGVVFRLVMNLSRTNCPRPLTTVARGRKRMQSLNATPVPVALYLNLGHLPPPVPLRATRLHSLGREDVISTLPRPKPPPVRALPPPPVSLYPIPPTQPLDLSERSRTKSQLKPSNSRRSNESRWGNIYTED
ncbi:hypothetical protein PSHT_01715, partial [Puccinia striiformis]